MQTVATVITLSLLLFMFCNMTILKAVLVLSF